MKRGMSNRVYVATCNPEKSSITLCDNKKRSLAKAVRSGDVVRIPAHRCQCTVKCVACSCGGCK